MIPLRKKVGDVYGCIKPRGQKLTKSNGLPQIATQVSLITERCIRIDCSDQPRRLPMISRSNPGATSNDAAL